MAKGKILFNENALFVIMKLSIIKKDQILNFEDCSDMNDKYLKKLHVVFEDGDEINWCGCIYLCVWKRTDGYAWLAKFTSAPVIYQCAKITYSCSTFFYFGVSR